jgi:hypothetical protein
MGGPGRAGWLVGADAKKCCCSHCPCLLHVMDPRQHTGLSRGRLLGFFFNKSFFFKNYEEFAGGWMNVDESIIVSQK